MKKVFTAIVAAMLVSSASYAGDLSSMMRAQAQPDITISLGCGTAGKANCGTVVQRLSAETTTSGVNLEAFTSKGSVESAVGVCIEAINGAVGQRDAFDYVTKTSPTLDRSLPPFGCANKFHLVGSPVYPYYGYLVARSDASFSSIQGIVRSAKPGKFMEISGGEIGSGGQVTINNILNGNPEWKTSIHIVSLDKNESMRALDSGKIDAFLIMDGPQSETIKAIREAKDKDSGKELYKFVEIDLSNSFYRKSVDWSGQPLYYEQKIPVAGLLNSDKTTIATDAVVIVGQKFYSSNKTPVTTLELATDKAQSPIRADLSVPMSWSSTNR